MALVGQFFQDDARAKRHPTVVECGWQIVRDGNQLLLQLSTYGSDHRAAGKKVSQTVQFDQDSAIILLGLIEKAFPEIRSNSKLTNLG